VWQRECIGSNKHQPEGTVMSKTEEKKDGAMDRRSFFRAGSGAAVVAATAIATGAEPAMAAESESERKKARYKETEHVKTFYRVNRY
jgi:hypothetical protein